MSFRKIILGLSGGVDSGVSAFLLKKKGFKVHAVFMKNWEQNDETGYCTGEEDWEDAQYICKKLEIPITQVNFVKEYWNNVFEHFLEDYKTGLTPNPDILCNKHIKFDYFFQHATKEMSGDAIAFGHYAQTTFGCFLENYNPNKNTKLLKAVDEFKDQTFFLSQIPQIALQKTMFPIGNLNKHEVKEIAKTAGLDRIVKKKESIGICFIGQRRFQNFISEYIDSQKGDFIDIESGSIVGQHTGLHNWTVGQRCKIAGCLKPYFVLRKEITQNIVYVVSGTDNPLLYTDIFYTEPPKWIEKIPFTDFLLKCEFRFQHTKPLVDCTIFVSNEKNGNLFVKLQKPLRAITPGQYSVFYLGSECLGNARILNPGPSNKI